MFLPSQVSVTSTKSSEHFSESNALTMFVWKLFQRKQNWSAITTYSAEIPAKINFLLNPTFDSKLTNAQIHVQTNEFNTPSELYTLQSHKSLDFLSIITVITIYLIKCIKMQCMTSIDTFFHFCSVSVCVCQSVTLSSMKLSILLPLLQFLFMVIKLVTHVFKEKTDNWYLSLNAQP